LERPKSLLIIAGNGRYPSLLAEAARREGVGRIAMAAFEEETSPETADRADEVAWLRVGQLGRLLDFARKSDVRHAMMAGQISPKKLFDLRPDFKALMLLATIKERNAESLFGAVANALASEGVEILPATTFLEDQLAPAGLIAGPKLKPHDVDDARFGFRIARETSRLDIGQTVVVRNGTVLAVEAFEGTNDAIQRGGRLGRGGGWAAKVSKPNQDMRFDVPVVGEQTIATVAEAGLRGIVVDAGRVLLLDRSAVEAAAAAKNISIYGIDQGTSDQ
jgi:DUF1009 family protein